MPNSQNVEVVLNEPLVDSVKMQIGRYDLVIVEQKDKLGFCRVDCCVASNADANIVLLEIKRGPYDAKTDKQFAEWCPREGTPEAAEWLKIMQAKFAGR